MSFGIDLASLRRYAIARSHFPPTDLPGALGRVGFVQADPIRAPAKRKLGYYALPRLWCYGVIGWGNVAVTGGAVSSEVGYVSGCPPRERAFGRALDEGLDRMREFLRAESAR